MKKLIFIYILCTAVIGVSQTSWTYRQLTEHAQKNNITLKQDQLKLEKAIKDLKAERVKRLPDLGINVYTAANSGRNLDPVTYQYVTSNFQMNTSVLQSNLNIYQGGKQNKTIRKTLEAKNLQKTQTKIDEQEVKGNVFSLCLEVQKEEELMRLFSAKLENLKEQKKTIEILFRNGRLTQSDIYELDVEIINLQYEIENFRYNKELALLNLKNSVGLSLDEEMMLTPMEISFPKDTLGYSVDELNTIAINSPNYKATKTVSSMAELDYRISRSAFAPSVTAIASYGSAFNTLSNFGFEKQIENNAYKNIGINIFIPLFSRNQNNIAIQKSRIEILYQDETSNQKLKDLNKSLQTYNKQMTTTAKWYFLLSKSDAKQQNIIQDANLHLSAGKIDLFQYLLKYQKQYIVQEKLIALKYDNCIAEKSIELIETGEIR